MSTFSRAMPVLRIFDAPRAIEFYRDFLEMNVDWEHRFEENSPVYLQVSRGDCMIQLSEHTGDALPGGMVPIKVDELDALCKHLADKKYKYARPGPGQVTEWSTKETVIRDPFGNKLVFWEPI